MVVGITLATIALFKSGGSGVVSFADYEGLRKRLQKSVGDEDRRLRSLVLVDDIAALLAGYDQSLKSSVDAYLVAVHRFEISSTQVIDTVIGPLEESRHVVQLSLIELRDQLRSVLTVEEWGLVFPNR